MAIVRAPVRVDGVAVIALFAEIDVTVPATARGRRIETAFVRAR
jgi:hypothetical protein